MRYLGLLGLLIAAALVLYLSAPKREHTGDTTYHAATGAAQHAAGAAAQHVQDIMKPAAGAENP
jgi:hypothetical protein